MAEIIKVDPEALDTAAKDIDTLSGNYDGKVNEFYKLVEDLKSTWAGADNDAFSKKMEEFRDDFTKLKEEMDQYAQHLRNAAANYRNTQDDAVKRANALSGNYNG